MCVYAGKKTVLVSKGERNARGNGLALGICFFETMPRNKRGQSARDDALHRGVAPVEGPGQEKHARPRMANVASYRISCFRFRWMIMSWTDPIVILSRFVSVALVKWP